MNRKRGEQTEKERRREKDIWQTLLKAFQKAFAVVDTFGSSLLHLKVTNASHYTSKPSFSETSYHLCSHSFFSPESLAECVFGLI